MPADQKTPTPHRSFTVRVPESLYIEIGELAAEEGVFLNTKVQQLLALGLGRHVSVNDALAQLIKKEMTGA